MDKEIELAVEHIKEYSFVTEVEVSFIGNSIFRKELSDKLESEDIKFYDFAEEYVDEGWLYSYYDAEVFDDVNDCREHSRKHYRNEMGIEVNK